jgi:hypothetical protein
LASRPEGLEPSFGEPFPAGDLVVDVVDDVVLGAGHAEEVRVLEDLLLMGARKAFALRTFCFVLERI